MHVNSRGPDFFIVGAPKCGTSSMHRYLRQHPHVYMPVQKDKPYFGSDLVHTIAGSPASLSEYLAWFADAPANVRVGDSCTLYMQSRCAAEEIARSYPDASIVVMLRNPVDLIVSLHSHNIWMTEEDLLDLDEALAAEPDRRAGRRVPPHCDFVAGLWYLDVAALADQLERYLRAFPREQVEVILFDDLRADTRAVVNRTLTFLGLSTDVELDLATVNARRAPRSLPMQAFLQRPPRRLEHAFQAVVPTSLHGRVLPFINRFNETNGRPQEPSPELRGQLAAKLRTQVERLEQLLDRDLTSWTVAV